MRKPALSRVRDMTEGNPLKLILAFAVPLFIGNIFQQFYSMVDTMVVGYHLGDTGIAIIYLFGGSLVRFTTGTTDEEMLRYAVMSLRIHFSTFPFLGVVFVMRHTLQAMGYKIIPILSSAMSCAPSSSRQAG